MEDDTIKNQPEIESSKDSMTDAANLLSESKEEKKKRVRDLDKMIKKRNSILEQINSSIEQLKPVEEDLKNKKGEFEELSPAVEKLKSQKEKFEEEIPELEEKHETAQTNLTEITNEINTSQEQKTSLENEVIGLTGIKNELKQVIEASKAEENSLKQSKSGLNTDIAAFSIEREKITSEIATLRDKLGLYSKDLSEIVRQNREHRNKYAGAIFISFILSLASIATLIWLMTSDKLISESIQKLFNNSINYIFYETLLIRVSVLGGLIFIILIFINLTRGFLSQYIRSQEKIASITVLDFLVSRLESKQFTFTDENVKREYAKEILKSQIDLMSAHLPKIMEDTSTNFDKTTKTNSPLDNIVDGAKEIAGKIKH
jgi:predicted  nucleic acid-binding Zn-ribbon protein